MDRYTCAAVSCPVSPRTTAARLVAPRGSAVTGEPTVAGGTVTWRQPSTVGVRSVISVIPGCRVDAAASW